MENAAVQDVISISEFLGPRLKACRVEARMTRQQTAEHIGMHAPNAGQTIAKWERGQSKPSLGRLEAYAAAFHKDLEWFFSDSAKPASKRPLPKSHQLEHLDDENCLRVLASFIELTLESISFLNATPRSLLVDRKLRRLLEDLALS